MNKWQPKHIERAEDGSYYRRRGSRKTVKKKHPVIKQKQFDTPLVRQEFAKYDLFPEFEYFFHPDCDWRFDLAFPAVKLFIEVQGGIWLTGVRTGRHNRGKAMLEEWEKLNAAAALGWRGMYVQPIDLLNTEFLIQVRDAVLYS